MINLKWSLSFTTQVHVCVLRSVLKVCLPVSLELLLLVVLCFYCCLLLQSWYMVAFFYTLYVCLCLCLCAHVYTYKIDFLSLYQYTHTSFAYNIFDYPICRYASAQWGRTGRTVLICNVGCRCSCHFLDHKNVTFQKIIYSM